MVITWNEIKTRAIEFSEDYKDATSERSDSQSFWNDFFKVFGIERRRVATFEEPARRLGDRRGSIDLFWKGNLIIEHKSRGQNLDKAYSQALDYFQGLKSYEFPKYVIVSDFSKFRVYNLDENIQHDFDLENFVDHVYLFDFISGYTRKTYKDEDPVNLEAAELMGKLHDSLKANGYNGHPLEVLLVRLMFCLFADDTGIFEKNQFADYIENKTNVDGSDVGSQLTVIFQTLNTPIEQRERNLDEDLKQFEYVNGSLFEEILRIPSFDSTTRDILLQSCYFDWSRVSPAIFGSLFQAVMESGARRDLGAHYTSEKNILKTINCLFLEELWNDFNSHKGNKRFLQQLLEKIGKIKIFDPACGCGTFLIISYRELRRLETQIHKQIRVLDGTLDQRVLDIDLFDRDINVDSMYGIELLEFPVRIAQVALWLVDHQMNIELSKELGEYYVRLPLRKSANVIQGNALRIIWEDFVQKDENLFILGNPPYVGKKKRTTEQNEDMGLICTQIPNYSILDYVSCWYVKAADYIQDTSIKVGFVSTNSITQGEQVGVLWDYLLNHKNIKIHFAHRTFKWLNEGRGAAHVYVIIVGFAATDTNTKYLFDYDTPNSDPMVKKVDNINAYLVNQDDIIIQNRNHPLFTAPEIIFGSMPNDDGNFLFNDVEKEQFLNLEPDAAQFIFPLISAREFLHGERRWCLWLKDANPSDLRRLPEIETRVRKVKEYRLQSTRAATRRLADSPYLFGEIRQPSSDYILIPRHSSENRKYIPIDFLSPKFIVSDSCCFIENCTLFHFGILTSSMHMAWVRQVCGRIKSDFRYSNKLVYNNFPWPENLTSEQIRNIGERAQVILDVRRESNNSSLADLYDPNFMPQRLLESHRKLDLVVEKCYRSKPFTTELDRLEWLFKLYKERILTI